MSGTSIPRRAVLLGAAALPITARSCDTGSACAQAPAAPLPEPAPAGPGWALAWSTRFPVDAPLGSFNATGSSGACPALPPRLAAEFQAYPAGWPDTATESEYAVGGYYDPARTVWISGGQMHVRVFRPATGPVHSAVVIPMAGHGRRYGRYVTVFRLAYGGPGFKSSYMLFDANGSSQGITYEDDFPEDEWAGPIYGFVHDHQDQQTFPTGTYFADRRWHTAVTEWKPGSLAYHLDGRLVGATSRGLCPGPMHWYLQHESSLNPATPAAPGSSARMDIRYLAYYAWTGQ